MNQRFSFKSWIFGACILVVFCTLALVGAYLQRSLRTLVIAQHRDSLQQQLILMRKIVSDGWKAGLPIAASDSLADQLGKDLGLRVTFILPDGKVIGDSDLPVEKVETIERHNERPEVIQAMKNGQGWSLRYSDTLNYELVYVAQLLGEVGSPEMVIRLAMPLENLAENLAGIRRLILWASLLGGLLSLGVAYILAQQIFQPVKELTRTALTISAGDLSVRLRRYPNHELGDLARAFDQMADHLQEEIEAVTRARDRLEAILRAMVEGVMVTDSDGRITLANRALRELLELSNNPLGRKPSEIIRNADLIEALQRVASGERFVTLEIRTRAENPRILKVEVGALPANEPGTGLVVVMHDITSIKKLDEMRRDFVANVSHELRTPLAAVRGAVETLLDGALDNPKFARKFTGTIQRHIDRLEALVVDLLELAKLESDQPELQVGLVSVQSLVHSATEAVREALSAKQINIASELPDEQLMVPGDEHQLEQAVVNLLENAVKYTDAKGRVTISVLETGGNVKISVTDTGIGISADHIPRIFERFYRVDKDRSRQVGGTGLGLAIVKHAAQAHGGRVEVQSRIGKGSVFTLVLPGREIYPRFQSSAIKSSQDQ